MNYNLEEIKERIDCAINMFLKEEQKLFEIDSSERNISQNFSIYLKPKFPEWDIDCEYNRYLKEVKKLKRKGEEKPIYTDIIIHHRNSKENLLVIELKKAPPYSFSNQKVKDDLERLQKMTSDDKYHYQFGLFILLFVKEKSCINPVLKYFQNGKEI